MRSKRIAQEPRKTKYRPIPDYALAALFEHARFLSSRGEFGAQLGANEDEVYDFSECDLDGTDLSLANLTASDFSGASLRRAWLVGTELVGAVFFRANLFKAHFNSANLTLASFVEANRSQAVFDDADTSQALWTAEDEDTFERDPKQWIALRKRPDVQPAERPVQLLDMERERRSEWMRLHWEHSP